MVERNEMRYQYIKLMKSGKSLKDIRALMRSTTTALDDEYTNKAEKKSLTDLVGGLEYLTRARAIDVMRLRFKAPNTLSTSREEWTANYITNYKGSLPHNWVRYGNLIRKGKPNPPRPGTSKRHIGKTTIIGASKVLRDANALVASLQNLVKTRNGKKQATQLAKQIKVLTTVTPS